MITLPLNWPNRERAQRLLERYQARMASQKRREEVKADGSAAPQPESPKGMGNERVSPGPEPAPARRSSSSGPQIVLALGVRAAARAVGVHPSTISREIQAGRLKAKRYGRRVLIRPADLRAWLNSLPDAKGVERREA